ncbi:uncharacterized protein JCM15063_000855 [Sporobolomyces koalae]|uniref:uncharacterized protein n=1 Tax=Sporobolomyces koalae TaxID=500713 RepID=UPI0031735939
MQYFSRADTAHNGRAFDVSVAAVYSIFTSPNHPPVPDHLPTLIVTPHGRPAQILYTYLHTNLNAENYLLTPSEAGDLCVAKLFPPDRGGGASRSGASSSHSHGSGGSANHVRCEASRNLRWTIQQTGIQNPIYKLTLPNPESPQEDQPLFQVSKPNPNATWWSLFYFTYAGHLIPPKRVEFGRIQKNTPESGGGTRVAIVGKSDEEKAVWKTLGEGNEDMVEWIVICAALVVLDDEIISAAEKASGGKVMRSAPTAASGSKLSAPPNLSGPPRSPVRAGPNPQQQRAPMPMQAPGNRIEPPPRSASAPIPVPQSGAYYTPPPPHPVLPPSHGAYDPRRGTPSGQNQPSYGPRTHSAPQQQLQQQQMQQQQQQQQQQLPYPGQAAPAPPTNRAPSGYRPGPPRPGMPPPQFQPGQAPPPQVEANGSAAARMVQQQVEAKRLQKLRR